MADSIPPAVRRSRMLDHIQRNGSASVNELARDYAVSAVTVHRDLEQLAKDGLVARIHGGARSVAEASPPIETDFTKRLRQAWEAKQQIAVRARHEIVPGSTIFIDHSTSCLALAKELERNPPHALTVVTNSPAIAYELHANSIHLIVAPGEVDQIMRMISGDWTEEFLSHLNFDVAFVSAAGLTLERGLTTLRQSLAGTLNAARAAAQRTIALIDSSKVGRDSLLSVFGPLEVEIIVDGAVPAELLADYSRAGMRFIVAEARGESPPGVGLLVD
jgi:DeoR/GlpR family transcriptional regulator of sugar metabolism